MTDNERRTAEYGVDVKIREVDLKDSQSALRHEGAVARAEFDKERIYLKWSEGKAEFEI